MLAIKRNQPGWRCKVGNRRERAIEEILADEQELWRGIAENEADLGRSEAAIDRRETCARARGAKEERIPAVMVLGQRRHPVPRSDPGCDQRVPNAIRPGIELGKARLAFPELHCGRLPPHACLCRRNIRQRPDGIQIDHFALPQSYFDLN
jgi:hypothetical protein